MRNRLPSHLRRIWLACREKLEKIADRHVRCPALIIQGGSDATVPVRSAESVASAMRAGGNSDVTVRIFPGVSHALLPDAGGLPTGWAALPAFLTAPDLLAELTRWSVAKLGPIKGK